jgi:hypothetical protein
MFKIMAIIIAVVMLVVAGATLLIATINNRNNRKKGKKLLEDLESGTLTPDEVRRQLNFLVHSKTAAFSDIRTLQNRFAALKDIPQRNNKFNLVYAEKISPAELLMVVVCTVTDFVMTSAESRKDVKQIEYRSYILRINPEKGTFGLWGRLPASQEEKLNQQEFLFFVDDQMKLSGRPEMA